MSIEQEIRDQIERNKELKQEVGYINSHLSILEGFCREDKQKQVDDAYKRGYEDGKASINKGCWGCKYESKWETENPCKDCSNCYTNKYEPMPKEDGPIEMGDEVICDVHNSPAIVTNVSDAGIYVLWKDGSGGWKRAKQFHKTGKHYDIQSILEAMKNG